MYVFSFLHYNRCLFEELWGLRVMRAKSNDIRTIILNITKIHQNVFLSCVTKQTPSYNSAVKICIYQATQCLSETY